MIDDFNKLSEPEKVELIFDANKIAEKVDNDANYQLFQIDNFFVESKTSLEGKFKRSFRTFTVKDLPVEYAGEIMSIPVVVSNNQLQDGDFVRPGVRQNEGLYLRAR